MNTVYIVSECYSGQGGGPIPGEHVRRQRGEVTREISQYRIRGGWQKGQAVFPTFLCVIPRR